ncbi:uncharacterized protein KZ484_004459 [Pholidichthys leucotaenia]
MSTQAVNLDTYSLSLLTAKEDILNPRSSTNWALFTYEGVTTKLKLADSGAGGVAELAGKFHIAKPQYGLCKVASVETGALRIAMIIWVGQNVEKYRRTECSSHIPAVKNFFKEAHVFVSAEKVEDVTEEKIRAELGNAQTHNSTQWVRRSSRSAEKEEIVGTNYRKTNAAMEMRQINRESFWARAEREEEERKEEERKKAAEERRRLERERILQERRDADERDRKMNEKLQMIEEQRRKQAEQEEEVRRKEKLRWEQQQREHEEDMRARLKRSESIEKAAEAAALVSQRSMNPREFFRQLSSSSSQSPTSPGSSRTGKPFRRYQRSLTDTAFIFSQAEESTASSPRSSPLISPFSRAPPSPIYRATSPPVSPGFCLSATAQKSRAPTTPPTSPPRPAPPASLLPSPPHTNNQVRVADEPRAASPAEPSAPPASPTLLATLSPSLVKNNPSQLHSDTLAASPQENQILPEYFEPVLPPQAPTTPLPKSPQLNTDPNTASPVHTELVADIGYKVQAVLVEEDEEEDVDEQEEGEPETQSDPCAVTTEPSQTEAEEGKEEEGEECEKEEEDVKENDEEDKEEEMEDVLNQDAEAASVEELIEVTQDEDKAEEEREEVNQSGHSQTDTEPAELEDESSDTDDKPICQEINHGTVILSTNGISLEEDETANENGTELTENEDPHAESEEFIEDNEEEISENGQKVVAEQQMCVRALYDYQAEDESEISFEPGDIIRDVETVDKAWWRGWSKDGRQGLFPANYVETI